jgi:hypothetical protein
VSFVVRKETLVSVARIFFSFTRKLAKQKFLTQDIEKSSASVQRPVTHTGKSILKIPQTCLATLA